MSDGIDPLAMGEWSPHAHEEYLKAPPRRVSYDQHADMIRNQLQSTGRIRLSFISLFEVYSACEDLGIDVRKVRFVNGYAVVDNS